MFLNKSIRAGYFFILIGLPLIFMSQLFLIYDLPKSGLFIGLSSLILILLIWGIAISKKIFLPKINKTFWLFLVLVILSIITSTVFSISPHISFFGSYWRQNGLVQFIFYILLFLSMIVFFSEEKENKKLHELVDHLCYGGILTAIYGVWQSLSGFGLRIYGTIGQTNSLATYLLMVLPFVFVNFLQSKNKKTNIFWGIGVFFIMTAMALTLSRAMMLGAIAIMIFLAIYYRKYLVLVLIGGLFLLLILLNIVGDYSFISDNVFLSRFLFKGWAFQSVQTRFVVWPSVVEMIQLKPFFGYGPETLAEAFQKFVNPQIFYFERLDSFMDRAHNEILDVVVNQGIFGLISYLGLIFITIKIALKKAKDPLILAGVCSLIGLFAANMFNFSISIHYALWWMIVAFLLVYKNQATRYSINFKKVILFLCAGLFTILLGLGIYFFSFKPVLADYYFAQGDLEKATRTNPNEIYYLFQAAEDSINNNQLEQADYYLTKIEEFGGAELVDDLFLRARWAIYKKNYPLAINYFKKAYEKGPFKPNTVLEWARLLSKMKDYQASSEKYDLYFKMIPFWEWARDLKQKKLQDQGRFVLFFQQNPDILNLLQEASAVAGLAGDKTKADFYESSFVKIKTFLRK